MKRREQVIQKLKMEAMRSQEINSRNEEKILQQERLMEQLTNQVQAAQKEVRDPVSAMNINCRHMNKGKL